MFRHPHRVTTSHPGDITALGFFFSRVANPRLTHFRFGGPINRGLIDSCLFLNGKRKHLKIVVGSLDRIVMTSFFLRKRA